MRNYRIDIDETDFGYRVGEIELINAFLEGGGRTEHGKDSLELRRTELMQFAKDLGVKSGSIRGKVIEHIRTNNRRHWDLLVSKGVISKKQLY